MSPPYSFQPNSNGFYFLCQVLNCAGCLETDPTVCNFCSYGITSISQIPYSAFPPSYISFGINGTCLECTAIHGLDLTTSQCIPCQVPQGCLMFKPEVKKIDDIILLVSCRFPA